MENYKYIFWQAIGIAITVPATTLVASGSTIDFVSTVLFVGIFFLLVGLVVNALQNPQLTVSEKFAPILMDFGANFLSAGIFMQPSLDKVIWLLVGVLLIEVFLLILYGQFLN